MHETYECLMIDDVETDVVIQWDVEDHVEDYEIGDARVFQTVTEYKIRTATSSDEVYDFDYAPLTAFEAAVSNAYYHNMLRP